MRIESNASLIQSIQARQAFQARPSQAAAPAAAMPEVEIPRAEVAPNRNTLNHLPYRDIQQVASKAGFVGVTEADIQQAYLRGESLLADYRV